MSVALETASGTTLPAQPAAEPVAQGTPLLARLKGPMLAILFPVAVLIFWHFATYGRKYSLIPPPSDVALAMWDLAFGGINDDAYSQTLHIHLLASLMRVYGGFAIALAAALPLGLMLSLIHI